MDDAKQQLVDKLKAANNILVTVSRDPTVDQLASCLGLALLLNKQGKHTAAVFSGQVPSTLEFLQPEDTLEKNTDSLRDFIIALDKSKADKLRYKVEDNVVRIFITPYKTSIGQDDLDFSQGDFNVDVVVALGVTRQEDLDEAITAHGRILHDATVASINLSPDGGLGSINWHNQQASSLSELVTDLVKALDSTLLDGQIATALLTGIVSATERFSNDKTSSQTMSASATLMAAGANQQLVASKLEEPAEPASEDEESAGESDKQPEDGTIEIDHEHDAGEEDKPDEAASIELPAPDDTDTPVADTDTPTDTPDDDNKPFTNDTPTSEDPTPPPIEQTPPAEPVDDLAGNLSPGPKLVTEPPTLGGTLTANSQPASLDPVTDPMSLPTSEPPQLLERQPMPSTNFTATPPPEPDSAAAMPGDSPLLTPAPSPPPPLPDQPEPSLSDLEEEVQEAELQATEEAGGLGDARDEVSRALNTATSALSPKPIEALNAQPLGDDLHPPTPTEPSAPPPLADSLPTPAPAPPPAEPATPANDPPVNDLTAPPPVPPPIPFQFGNTNPPQQ